jgi:hypothetical protein
MNYELNQKVCINMDQNERIIMNQLLIATYNESIINQSLINEVHQYQPINHKVQLIN